MRRQRSSLGFFSTAKLMRLTRAAMLDVLTSDYLRTARAKGLTGTRVVLAHALRNAWIPIVTQLGVAAGSRSRRAARAGCAEIPW